MIIYSKPGVFSLLGGIPIFGGAAVNSPSRFIISEQTNLVKEGHIISQCFESKSS